MNARQLATAVRVSEATVSRLLSGQRGPSIRLIPRIRDALGWRVDEQVQAIERGTYGQALRFRMERTLVKEPAHPVNHRATIAAGPGRRS